jgi:hypothetical protein
MEEGGAKELAHLLPSFMGGRNKLLLLILMNLLRKDFLIKRSCLESGTINNNHKTGIYVHRSTYKSL